MSPQPGGSTPDVSPQISAEALRLQAFDFMALVADVLLRQESERRAQAGRRRLFLIGAVLALAWFAFDAGWLPRWWGPAALRTRLPDRVIPVESPTLPCRAGVQA
jgi:hypothetical protein